MGIIHIIVIRMYRPDANEGTYTDMRSTLYLHIPHVICDDNGITLEST